MFSGHRHAQAFLGPRSTYCFQIATFFCNTYRSCLNIVILSWYTSIASHYLRTPLWTSYGHAEYNTSEPIQSYELLNYTRSEVYDLVGTWNYYSFDVGNNMGAMVNTSETLRPAVSTSSATASTKSMPLLICDRFGLGLITWAFFNVFTSAPISPYLSASFAPALSSSSFVHSGHHILSR